jgi:two-component system sensor histidine kinase UhpB
MTSHYRLLMVEDSADDAELLLYALDGAAFTYAATRVETEDDYTPALATIRPDVVLCDYNLPRFSAERALQILQERQLDIPFIIVSHHIGEDAAVTAIQNGASDYLQKSRLGRLPKAIDTAVERHTSRQQKAAAEKALSGSEAMKRGILNSLNMRIAVVDSDGLIVATNKVWEEFGSVRGSLHAAHAAVGDNYLALLKDAAAKGDEVAERSIAGVLAVINREVGFASIEYEHAVSGGMRWFVARAMPLQDSADGAVISHEDITDRMLAHHALADANKRLQAMSKRVLSIQEDERRSISRELHDDIGQSLTALKMGLHRLAQRTEEDGGELLTQCIDIADTTLDKLRDLSHELRPPQLDQLGLEGALEWLVGRQRAATGLDVECEFVGLSTRLPAELESVCYRIAQEALNNATCHANAKKIRIRVECNDRLLILSIRDDGTGFDVETAQQKAAKAGSLGLISMEERAQLASGRLKIRTGAGNGTTIQAIFVVSEPNGTAATGNIEQVQVTIP